MTTTRERAPVERLAYTVPEAARALGVHSNTVRNWIMEGRIRITRIGRLVRIPSQELHRLVQNADHSVSK